MAAKLIRDGVLDSERVANLTHEARWLYLTILLSADDVGLFEATDFKLGKAADIPVERMPAVMASLMEQDLIRLYLHGGKRYGFLPRYGQRLQIVRARHPLPPAELVSDDLDAQAKLARLHELAAAREAARLARDAAASKRTKRPSKNNDLPEKSTVDHGGLPCTTVAHGDPPSEPEPEPEPEPSSSKKEEDGATALRVVPPAPPPSFDGLNGEALNGKAVVPIAAAFELPDAWGFDAEALGFKPAEVLREAEKFRQYWTAGRGSGTRRSVKGWRQSWSNWLAKTAERQR